MSSGTKFRCSLDGAHPRALFHPLKSKSPTPSGFLTSRPRKIRDPDLTMNARPNHAKFETCAPPKDSYARDLLVPTSLALSRKDRESKPRFQTSRLLPSTLHCGGQRVIPATISTHSRAD